MANDYDPPVPYKGKRPTNRRGRMVNLTPEQADAIEAGAGVCPEHGGIFWAGEFCMECRDDEIKGVK
jgi:hypothetical protein